MRQLQTYSFYTEDALRNVQLTVDNGGLAHKHIDMVGACTVRATTSDQSCRAPAGVTREADVFSTESKGAGLPWQ